MSLRKKEQKKELEAKRKEDNLAAVKTLGNKDHMINTITNVSKKMSEMSEKFSITREDLISVAVRIGNDEAGAGAHELVDETQASVVVDQLISEVPSVGNMVDIKLQQKKVSI